MPPALALLVVGLQLAVDVPHHPMIAREEPEPPKKKTAAARTPRPRKYRARGVAYTERLRKSWSARPIADEPKDPRFAEHHEELLRAVVRKAEAAAVPGAEPGSVETDVACHSVRCELELCTLPLFADTIVEPLPKFEVGGRSLWHSFEEVPSERASTTTRVCHRYVVDFAVEGADPRRLRLTR